MPKDKTTVTTISIPKDLHKAVKIQSVEDQRSASSIYAEGARLVLNKKKRKSS